MKLVGVLNGVCSFEYCIDVEYIWEVYFEFVEGELLMVILMWICDSFEDKRRDE